MKVVLTSPYYPPHIGGVQIHTRALARGLRERGYDVEVVTSIGYDERVKVTTVPCLRIPYSPIPLTFPRVYADVYHSHIPSPFFARCVLRQKYRPHIVTYHNDVVMPNKVNGKPIPRFVAHWLEHQNERVVRPILDAAEIVIATTSGYARTSPILSDYLDKVKIIPNAIRVNEFVPGRDAGEREKIVLYAGRLVEYKGLPILIRAMKTVRARLVVLGEGEDRQRFEELANHCGVRAEFRGRVSDTELKDWLRRARVLVLPAQSRLEAFGIILLEAMACKTPVIASNLPGVEEVARNGGLVFGDEAELILHLTQILEDDVRATELGRRGRASVEQNYDWESVLNAIEAVYGSAT
ncbi:MAG: glycosyltransferase family 1 protein [Methanophagales archaeon ANME-1-THS]|nr:MAG: glycosyltransferase family 1 protein [Methanophagales archaeon ANME-1-THS]